MMLTFAVLWAAGWWLAAHLRARRNSAAAVAPEAVSVIIPARDEEHNLPRLLASIQQGPVRPLEIIVVDDASSDGTAEVARAAGARVLPAGALPEGWRGKPWACEVGARAAGGSWLLFLDADTWFEPGGFSGLLDHAQGAAVSVVPWHATGSAVEDLSMFFNICMTAGVVPDGLGGQVLLVKRDDHLAAGGHAAVRGRVLENLHFAKLLRDAGVPTRCSPGKGIVSFRMYPEGLRTMIPGWSKGFTSGAGGMPGGRMALIVAWMIGLAMPLPAMALTGEIGVWSAAWLLCAAQLGWIARRVGGFRWLSLLLYPLPLWFFFLVFARAASGAAAGSEWKGRRIDVP